LADAGFPVVGDSLYGLESSARAGRMFLHHFSIAFPGFQARWMPDWDLLIADEIGKHSL
jgi:23S rRNA-/tRNA-specific pseudouridylate synthase